MDAFESALKSAKPTYSSINGIVNSHQGFDANGKVTDTEKAKATVQEMRTRMQELKSAMNGTGKALREALKVFREACEQWLLHAASCRSNQGTVDS